MKKTIIFGLMLIGTGIGIGTGKTDCVEFPEGEICLNAQNKGNGEYEVTKNANMKNQKDYYVLSCYILKPDNKRQDIGTCNQKFEYNGNGYYNVEYNITLQENSKTLETSHYFVNLSKQELNDIKYVNNIWNKFTKTLEKKHPQLKQNNKWQRLSSGIHENIKKLINAEKSKFKSYNEIKETIISYAKLTKEIIRN